MEKTIISDASLLGVSDKLEIAALVGGQSNTTTKQSKGAFTVYMPG